MQMCMKTRSEMAKNADLVELAVSDTTPYRDKLNATVNVPVAVSVWQGRLSVKAAL